MLDPNDPIANWANSINRLLRAYRDVSAAAADHSDSLGRAREFFVSEVLRRFLPQSLHVGTGQIIDIGRQQSRQQDIIVYRYDMPLLASMADPNLYFLEGVVSTIEIKSRLEKGKLEEALENCRSVKALESSSPERGYFSMRRSFPTAYIFGYYGYRRNLYYLKRTLADWIQKNYVTTMLHLPEVIATEGLVVIKNDYRFFDSNSYRQQENCDRVFIAAPDDCPLHWLLYHMLGHIGSKMSYVFPSTKINPLLLHSRRARKELATRAEFWGKWNRDTGEIQDLD